MIEHNKFCEKSGKQFKKCTGCVLEEILEKASHSFHPYCCGDDKNCYEKLKEIISEMDKR
jgi:hypothetical protein